MAASVISIYKNNIDAINIDDLTGVTLKIHLVTSSYTPDTTNTGDTSFSSASANEISGGGYSGGFTLTNVTKTAVAGGFKISSDNISVTASGGDIPAWRYGIIAVSGVLWGITNPVIGIFTGNSAPADIPATGNGQPLNINCPANGWFTVS